MIQMTMSFLKHIKEILFYYYLNKEKEMLDISLCKYLFSKNIFFFNMSLFLSRIPLFCYVGYKHIIFFLQDTFQIQHSLHFSFSSRQLYWYFSFKYLFFEYFYFISFFDIVKMHSHYANSCFFYYYFKRV